MSIIGSFFGYENNNEIKHKPQFQQESISVVKPNEYSSNRNKMLNSSVNSMGKPPCPSLNSSISNSVITTASTTTTSHQHYHQSHNQQINGKHHNHNQQQSNINNTRNSHSKRKIHKNQYNNNQQQYQQSHLHLNSLWSIWYGVLITLFQGYLAIHGAYRFLGCSLIQWKIEPVVELNIQIVLCGVVFILLPLFFASAVFKVGNLANDGVKLATIPERRCSLSPQDGLEEEAKGGTLRALWTHGGPTAAFIHILIALCLMLPRLLLEARIIENGLLPRENIWRTELDFISTNRDRMIVLSYMKSPYQNISKYYNETEDIGLIDEVYNGNNNNSDKFTQSDKVVGNSTSTFLSTNINYLHPNKSNDDDENDEDTDDEDNNAPIYQSNKELQSFENFGILPTNPLPVTQTTLPTTTISSTISQTTPIITIYTTSITTNSRSQTQRSAKLNRKNGGRKKLYKSRNEERKSKSEQTERDLELKAERIDFSRFNEFEMSTVFEANSNINLQNLATTVSAQQYQDTVSSDERRDSSKTQHDSKFITKDSNIHLVKSDKLSDYLLPTQTSTNSKIIEIKTKKVKRMTDDEMQVEVEPEFLISTTFNTTMMPTSVIARLDGFSGMLQTLFGVEKKMDVTVFNHPPSMEFINLVLSLIVWSVRYPAVFWTTTKPFAAIFSIQMISSSLDIIFGFTGVSNLYKLQIVSEVLPIHNPGLILNAVVTLSLYMLSTILLIASSLILYLYGHGRLAARMRDRSMITMKTSDTWIYFAHCASLCFVLALSVVKAPLLNDLSATYRNNLNCPTFISALVSVVHLFLWIVIWLGLTAKRRWAFKLPPMQQYGVTKGATQPLLISTRIHNTGVDSSSNNSNMKNGNGGGISTTSSTDGVEDIYWPKLTPSSPKLKVTFNEVTSTSDDVLLISEQDGKRHTSCGTKICLTSITGETDDGDYATLRKGPGAGISGIVCGGNNLLRLSEYEELPPPPALLLKLPSHNGSSGDLLDDNISEEGKLLECVRDDSVTYASTRDLEPPHPPKPKLQQKLRNMRSPLAQPENMQLPPSPTDLIGGSLIQEMQQHLSHRLVSPLAPVTVTVHTNEAHISSSSTPRCLRRADSGVPNEALTPRSDTTSTTESTTSPPERAPSESSSGVHSGEEREEVIIRPRASCKPPAKLPQPAIEEEPYGRSTNMRMSSFNNNELNTKFSNISSNNINSLMTNSIHSNSNSSATLPSTRTVPQSEHRGDYSHCNTMPLPIGTHQTSSNVSHNHKSQVYSPLAHTCITAVSSPAKYQQLNHTTLPNGVRYSNPHFLKRLPHVTKAESPYGHLGYGSGHHTFSKLLQDPLQSLAGTTIHEDRDSANYSMSSESDCMYMNTHHLN